MELHTARRRATATLLARHHDVALRLSEPSKANRGWGAHELVACWVAASPTPVLHSWGDILALADGAAVDAAALRAHQWIRQDIDVWRAPHGPPADQLSEPACALLQSIAKKAAKIDSRPIVLSLDEARRIHAAHREVFPVTPDIPTCLERLGWEADEQRISFRAWPHHDPDLAARTCAALWRRWKGSLPDYLRCLERLDGWWRWRTADHLEFHEASALADQAWNSLEGSDLGDAHTELAIRFSAINHHLPGSYRWQSLPDLPPAPNTPLDLLRWSSRVDRTLDWSADDNLRRTAHAVAAAWLACSERTDAGLRVEERLAISLHVPWRVATALTGMGQGEYPRLLGTLLPGRFGAALLSQLFTRGLVQLNYEIGHEPDDSLCWEALADAWVAGLGQASTVDESTDVLVEIAGARDGLLASALWRALGSRPRLLSHAGSTLWRRLMLRDTEVQETLDVLLRLHTLLRSHDVHPDPRTRADQLASWVCAKWETTPESWHDDPLAEAPWTPWLEDALGTPGWLDLVDPRRAGRHLRGDDGLQPFPDDADWNTQLRQQEAWQRYRLPARWLVRVLLRVRCDWLLQERSTDAIDSVLVQWLTLHTADDRDAGTLHLMDPVQESPGFASAPLLPSVLDAIETLPHDQARNLIRVLSGSTSAPVHLLQLGSTAESLGHPDLINLDTPSFRQACGEVRGLHDLCSVVITCAERGDGALVEQTIAVVEAWYAKQERVEPQTTKGTFRLPTSLTRQRWDAAVFRARALLAHSRGDLESLQGMSPADLPKEAAQTRDHLLALLVRECDPERSALMAQRLCEQVPDQPTFVLNRFFLTLEAASKMDDNHLRRARARMARQLFEGAVAEHPDWVAGLCRKGTFNRLWSLDLEQDPHEASRLADAVPPAVRYWPPVLVYAVHAWCLLGRLTHAEEELREARMMREDEALDQATQILMAARATDSVPAHAWNEVNCARLRLRAMDVGTQALVLDAGNVPALIFKQVLEVIATVVDQGVLVDAYEDEHTDLLALPLSHRISELGWSIGRERGGRSLGESGRNRAGERDLVLQSSRHTPIALYEALVARDGHLDRSNIGQHLDKLMGRYDAVGVRAAVFAVYVRGGDLGALTERYVTYLTEGHNWRGVPPLDGVCPSEVLHNMGLGSRAHAFTTRHNRGGAVDLEILHVLWQIEGPTRR